MSLYTGTALKGLVPAVEPSLIHPISRKLCCKCCRQRVMNANEALKYVPIEDRQKSWPDFARPYLVTLVVVDQVLLT